MKDYARMSDFEINKMVSAYLWGSICAVDGVVLHNERDGTFDPCNNPADAWPILLENEISLVKWRHDDVWAAWSGAGMAYGEVECEYIEHDENPLRAAMIVFLMMKEGK